MPLPDNPYLCPISGVRVNQTEARIGSRASIVSLEFKEQKVTSSILEFSLFY